MAKLGSTEVFGDLKVARNANIVNTMTSPIVAGSSIASGTLTLQGTSNATKGTITLDGTQIIPLNLNATATAGSLSAATTSTGTGNLSWGGYFRATQLYESGTRVVITTDSRLTDSRTPTAHDLSGSLHNNTTLANLNLKISDATLIDTNDSRLSNARTPTAHNLIDTTGHAVSGLTTGHVIRASGATTYAFAQLSHADLASVSSDQHHAQNHALINTTGHTVSGLTTGHFLKATGATTYGFAAHGLSATDVGAEPTLTKGDLTASGAISLSATRQVIGGAAAISHSTADGYLHVPATSTTNNGKVLTAGATAGSISWADLPAGGSANTIKSQEFTATASQTLFTLTNGTYTTGSNLIFVYVSGVRQPQSAYTETSTSSFTLSEGVPVGTKVYATWFQDLNLTELDGITSVTASAPLASSGGLTPNITHADTAGYKHVPTGGSTGQFLKYGAASGVAAWSAHGLTATDVGAEPTLTKNNLTASGSIAVSATSQVIGSAVAISHSTADGHLHVPATSTTNNGKVLTAGATAGSLSWANVSNEVTLAGTQTLTNKRITPRIGTITSGATITPTGDTSDMYTVTALAAATTIAAPSGTPTEGQSLRLRIKDNGTARTIAWNAIYRAIGVALPTTTKISKTMYIGMIYNATDTKWDVLAVSEEA